MVKDMKIIFAQGNPGTQYAFTRHNIGFVMIDQLAKAWGVEFVKKTKFHADIAEYSRGGEKILLVKPATFYNETGQAARLIADFYKLTPPTDFLVIHDDLALPFGTIRTRKSGSDAGNNGIKSLNAHLDVHYARIRIGIFNDQRTRMPDADFVLAQLNAEEKKSLPLLSGEVMRFVDGFIDNNFILTKVSVLPSSVE